MPGRNPLIGRHSAGASVARSGIRPPSRTGSASGSFVGTGVNQKTAGRSEMQPAALNPNRQSGNQLDQWTSAAPEPFRNSVPGARLSGIPTHPDFRAGNGQAFAASLREKKSRPMTQAQMNTATGHKAEYRPAGYNDLNSGFPGRGKRVVGDPRDVPVASMRSNRDLYGKYVEDQKFRIL